MIYKEKIFLNKIISIVIMITLIIAFVPNISRAEEVKSLDGVTATLFGDGTLAFSGNGEIKSALIEQFDYEHNIKKIVIGEGITKIGMSAFSYCKELKEIDIPSSVDYIGNSAFLCCGLESAKISAKNIGESVFGRLLRFNYSRVFKKC